MKQNIFLLLTISACSIIQLSSVDAQIFDQLMERLNNRDNGVQDPARTNASPFANMFKDVMTVNVPMFYDMVRNGSSMGINVLSGMVKVERGEEAEKSGLQGTGSSRPLSVRVFGVPVYERGIRTRNPENKVNVPSSSEDEDLPVYN